MYDATHDHLRCFEISSALTVLEALLNSQCKLHFHFSFPMHSRRALQRVRTYTFKNEKLPLKKFVSYSEDGGPTGLG